MWCSGWSAASQQSAPIRLIWPKAFFWEMIGITDLDIWRCLPARVWCTVRARIFFLVFLPQRYSQTGARMSRPLNKKMGGFLGGHINVNRDASPLRYPHISYNTASRQSH
jgi:hypothetical protein